LSWKEKAEEWAEPKNKESPLLARRLYKKLLLGENQCYFLEWKLKQSSIIYLKDNFKNDHCITSHHSTPHHTTPYHIIPCHITPYHTTPYHTIPHHTTPYHTQCCNSYSLFVTSYSYSYITKNTTSYRYKVQMPKCN
jgi:hypothetical protein